MSRFRKKPVVIDAWNVKFLCRCAGEEWLSLPTYITDAYEKGILLFCPEHISVKTLEGTMRAELDDMLIRGINGELYPCKPDIFEKTYEAVQDEY